MKVADMHCDTILAILRGKEQGKEISLCKNNLNVDLERMKKGDYLIQNFAIFLDLEDPMLAGSPFRYAMKMADVFYREMEKNKDWIRPVTKYEEIEENRKNGRMSALLTLEEGEICEGDPSLLRDFYRMGARMMTLTWNHENELASPNVVPGGGHNIWPCAPNTETGLKEKGFEFLAEMERLHIIADVSHLSDKGFWDIVEHSTRPFAASHSNCRALAPHCRNLTDEMIRALANKGGLVGLNYCSGFLDNQPEEKLCRSTTALMAKHAAHFKQVGGIEIIGLGSDFDGIGGKLEMDDCSKLPLLADALRREGFTEDEVEAIFYRNARRFFEENL